MATLGHVGGLVIRTFDPERFEDKPGRRFRLQRLFPVC